MLNLDFIHANICLWMFIMCIFFGLDHTVEISELLLGLTHVVEPSSSISFGICLRLQLFLLEVVFIMHV